MARQFHTLDDGCLVEINEKNKKKFKPDKFEYEPVAWWKLPLWIIGGFFAFFVWILLVILKVAFHLIKD